ncbi:MAG: 3TM-type holin [Alphaproteobacteria bacterium]
MIETVVAKVGLPILINVLSETLKTIDTPVTKGAGKALEQVDEAIRAGRLTHEQIAEANRHVETLAAMKSEELKANLAEANKTIRAEVASQDKYVRRMRPTFGYIMAVSWAGQMLGIAYVIVFDTQRAGYVLNAMGSLSAIWAVGLSVLGIYVYKRSEDKKFFGLPPETISWKS